MAFYRVRLVTFGFFGIHFKREKVQILGQKKNSGDKSFIIHFYSERPVYNFSNHKYRLEVSLDSKLNLK